ncbi:type IV secretory system conjugative DNA transfer family protein, partial [Helicobacter ganmani]|uniref:type IV secretory system conjugative DNA transfer family protein n=3 Tax=Helicobacter TaxID=209 RepID=UPI003A8C69D7
PLGIIFYFLMVKIVFNPDILAIPKVALQIFNNIGNPALKLKAYFALFMLFAPFLLVVIWFFMNRPSSAEDYGSARFARKEDYEKLGISHDKGLILGTLIEKDKYKFIRAGKPLATLVIASPGSGKTAGIIIPNLLVVPNSCIVFDIKGELYDKTAGFRQEVFKNEIQKFSPFSWDNTLFYNPFDNKIIKDFDYVLIKKLAEQVATLIFVGEKGKESDHWLVSAKTLFVFWAEYYMQKNKHTTLYEIYQSPKMDYFNMLDERWIDQVMIENPDSGELERNYEVNCEKLFLQQVSEDESLDTNTRNQANAYIGMLGGTEIGSVKSTFDTFMKVFSNPQVKNATSKMSFTYEDLREKRISLYVVIQTEDIEVLKPLIRIFTESTFIKLMSGAECPDPNKFIYVYLDEFVRFGAMNFVLEAPALCRSYGLLPVYISQSYEQISITYGQEKMKVLKNNSGYQVIFTLNSEEDAKATSDLIGDFTHEKASISQGSFDFFKSNVSKSKEAKKLLSPQDLKNLSSDDLIVLIKGFYKLPVPCKVPYWFKNKEWNNPKDKNFKCVVDYKVKDNTSLTEESKETENKGDSEDSNNESRIDTKNGEATETNTESQEKAENKQSEMREKYKSLGIEIE